MEKLDSIREVADCLARPHMRHFFDKKMGLVVLSAVGDEIVDFINIEIKRLEAHPERYIEIPALSKEKVTRLIASFADQVVSSKIKSLIYNDLIKTTDLRKFTNDLKKYPDIFDKWSVYIAKKLQIEAEKWLDKKQLV